MKKVRKARTSSKKAIPSSGATIDDPSDVTRRIATDLIVDALSPESRATLAKYAVPGVQAENLPLAPGETLSERMRHRSRVGEQAEIDHPDVRVEEAKAATLWAKHRENVAAWRATLEADIHRGRNAFIEGNLGVLLDTLIHCSQRDGCLFGQLSGHGDHWVEIPRWTIDALLVLAAETLPTVRAKGKGQHARWSASWKQNQIDYERWKTVRWLRESKVRFTDNEVFEKAVSFVAPEAAGGADAVRRSYRLVQKRMKSQPGRYTPLDYGGVMNRRDSLP
jgi:hypothetical protein